MCCLICYGLCRPAKCYIPNITYCSAGLSAKFISGFADVASILGSYLRPAGETLAPGRSEADPSTFIPPNGVKQLQNLGEFHKALAANDKVNIMKAGWHHPACACPSG